MVSGQSILGSHLLDLLLPTANSNVGGEVATVGNQGSNSFMRFYDLDQPLSNAYIVGMSNQDFMIMKQIGATEVGIGTSRVRVSGATAEVAGTLSTSNITTYNSDSNVYFGGKNVAGIQNINFSGSLLQGGEPFKTSQWTTSNTNIYITGSNVGIGTASPSNEFHVIGDGRFSGTVYANQFIDSTGASITCKTATVYNGAVNGTKTLYTNATTASDRILFTINLKAGRYLISASIPFYNLSGTSPIDTVNWAQIGIYKASTATFTNSTSPIYVSPISSIGSSSSDLHSVPFNLNLLVDETVATDFVVAVSGKGHQLQFGNAANVPELKLYAIPVRGLGVDDPISTRQAIQINAVRQMFTATASQTSFAMPAIEGYFTADNSNADVYVDGTKLRHTEQYDVAAAFNSLSNLTIFTVETTTGVSLGAKVDISVWPYAIATDYYQSGYLYQNITNISTPWLNVAGGGVRAVDRVIVDGDLYVQGNIYGGCNTSQFSAGIQWDSVSTISCNVIGTLNIIDGAVTPAKTDFSIGNIGIGTTSAQAPLHVVGTTLVAGDIIPTSCNVFNLGSSNYRFKELYLSGNTINIDGLLISKDTNTGGLSVKGSDNQLLDTSTCNLFAIGNIGIGTTYPVAKMHILRTGTGDIVRVDDVNADTSPFIINQDGNVGVGITLPTSKLHVSENIQATGSINTATQFLGNLDDTTSVPSFSWTGNSNSGIYRPVADTIGFVAAGVEKVRISSTGNIGIGTTNPLQKLHVIGTTLTTSVSATTITASSTVSCGSLSSSGAVSGTSISSTSGNISSANNITAAGNITASGDVTAFSDARLKTNIQKIKNPFEILSKIHGYCYERIDKNNQKQIGVLAQEVQEVLPEVVVQDENGMLSVSYGNMIALLIECLHEIKQSLPTVNQFQQDY